MKIYTKKGDDGTTGLFYGGRVRKDSDQPSAYGVVDEAQAILGVARVEAERGSELDEMLVSLERDMYVLMAELATAPENRDKLTPGQSSVSQVMVDRLEPLIDDLTTRFEQPKEFVLPGQNQGRCVPRPRPHRRAPRRASRALCRAAAFPRGPVPQSPLRLAVDHGPLARGRGAPRQVDLTKETGVHMSIEFSVTRSAPRDASAIGIGVFTEGAVGRALGIDPRGSRPSASTASPGKRA